MGAVRRCGLDGAADSACMSLHVSALDPQLWSLRLTSDTTGRSASVRTGTAYASMPPHPVSGRHLLHAEEPFGCGPLGGDALNPHPAPPWATCTVGRRTGELHLGESLVRLCLSAVIRAARRTEARRLADHPSVRCSQDLSRRHRHHHPRHRALHTARDLYRRRGSRYDSRRGSIAHRPMGAAQVRGAQYPLPACCELGSGRSVPPDPAHPSSRGRAAALSSPAPEGRTGPVP